MVTVDAIVQASAQVLLEEGYANLTTNRVAKVAGVSIGTLYQYFSDKDALMAELVERHVERMAQAWEGALTSFEGLSPQEILAQTTRAMIEAQKVDPALYQALQQQLPRVGDTHAIDNLETRIIALVTSLLLRTGLRSDAPTLVAMIIVRASVGLVRSTLRNNPELVEDPRFERELNRLLAGYLGLPELEGPRAPAT